MKLDVIQKKHFDKEENRYDVNKIFNPPIHTKLEIDKLISLIPKGANNVADFGSGNGRLTVPLLEKGYIVTAIDISKKSLLQLETIVRKYNYRLKTETSFTKKVKYEAIVGCDVLHHIDLNVELENINEFLKKDGAVVFSEPNILNFSWILYFFLKRIWKYEKGIGNFSYYNLKKVLLENRFISIQIIGFGLLPRIFFQNDRLCRINDLLGNLPILKLFAYRYIIKAVK